MSLLKACNQLADCSVPRVNVKDLVAENGYRLTNLAAIKTKLYGRRVIGTVVMNEHPFEIGEIFFPPRYCEILTDDIMRDYARETGI